LFTNPSFHTLLWIWWDEYDPSPNIQYGTMIHKGFISTSNNWDEYSQLRMIENTGAYPPWRMMPSSHHDRHTRTGVLKHCPHPSLHPDIPSHRNNLGIHRLGCWRNSPLLLLLNFGDGTSATGASATHEFSKTGTYSVTVTVTDSNGSTSTSTLQVTVSNSLPTITFLYIGLIAGGAISISVFLAKYLLAIANYLPC